MEDTNILNVTFWEYSEIQRPMKMEKGESSPCIKFTDFAGWSTDHNHCSAFLVTLVFQRTNQRSKMKKVHKFGNSSP